MPEISKSNLIKLNSELAKRGMPLVKGQENPLSGRGFNSTVPVQDAIQQHILDNQENASIDTFKRPKETVQQSIDRLTKQDIEIGVKLQTADRTSNRYGPGGSEVKSMYDKASFSPSDHINPKVSSEYDKLLQERVDIARKISRIYGYQKQVQNAGIFLLQGKTEEAADAIRKASNIEFNNRSELGNLDLAEGVEKFKIDLIKQESKKNGFDLNQLIPSWREFQKLTPAQQKDHPLKQTIAQLGARWDNLTAGEVYYNDEAYRDFTSGMKAQVKGYKGQESEDKVLQSGFNIFASAYQDYLAPLVKEGDKLNKSIEDREKAIAAASFQLRNMKDSIKNQDDYNNYLKISNAYNNNIGKISDQDDKERQRLNDIQKEFKTSNKDLGSYSNLIYTSEYSKARVQNQRNEDQAQNDNLMAFRFRVGNVAKDIKNIFSDPLNLAVAKPQQERDYAIDFHTNHSRWTTGEFDAQGNPVMSDMFRYKGADGDTHYNWSAGGETAASQFIQMYGIAKLTNLFAGIAGAMGSLAKYKNLSNVSNLSRAALNSEIGVRALTIPAVYLTSYPRTYYDNIGNFKTNSELKEFSKWNSLFESASESILPDVRILNGLKTTLPKTLSADQIKMATRYLKDLPKGASRTAFLKNIWETSKSLANKTFQEAIVEEEANYLANSIYENYKKDKRPNGDYRQSQEYSLQGAIDLGIEATWTMLPSMLIGARADYKHFQQQNSYNFTKPESLTFHRWNIATNGNYFKDRVDQDVSMSSEDKAKAHKAINEYENILKESALKIIKPDKKTLAVDSHDIFMHFNSVSEKRALEPKIIDGTITPEEKAIYDNADHAINLIEKDQKDWMALTPQGRQDKWFKWYGQSLLDSSFNKVSNSTFMQLGNIASHEKQIDKAYSDNLISKEIYEKYKEKINEAKSLASSQSVENLKANIANIERLSPIDIQWMANRDLPLAKLNISENIQEQEDWFKKMSTILYSHYQDSVNKVKKATEAIPDEAAPVSTQTPTSVVSEETPSKDFTRFAPIYEATTRVEKKKLTDTHFDSISPDSLSKEIEDFVAYKNPSQLEQFKAAIEDSNWKKAKDIAPSLIHSQINRLKALREVPKEEETKTPAQEDNSIEAKKADIERRRKEEFDKMFEIPFNEESNNYATLGDKIDAKYDKELADLETKEEYVKDEEEQPVEKEKEIPALTNPEEWEDNDEWEWGMDARPISGLISISDEYDTSNKKQQTSFSKDINEFLSNTLQGNEDKYFGRLVGNTLMFKNNNVDIEAIESILESYWKEEIKKPEALIQLTTEFKGFISPGAIVWHLEDNELSDLNKAVYGDIPPNRRFQDITLKSFTLGVFSKKDPKNIVTVTSKNQPIVRSLPKVKNDDGRFVFWSIIPLSTSDIQDDLKQLYQVQEIFKTRQSNSIKVSINSVSNGFNTFEGTKVVPKINDKIEIVKEKIPGVKAGTVLDKSGRRLQSDKLSPTDIQAIAYIIKHPYEAQNKFPGDTPTDRAKAMKSYVLNIVYLRGDELTSFAKMSYEELKDAETSPLATKYYNVRSRSINSPEFTHYSMDGSELKSTLVIAGYRGFIIPHLYRWEVKNKVEGGNKKIYFSLGAEAIEKPSPVSTAAIQLITLPVVEADDSSVLSKMVLGAKTIGELKAVLDRTIKAKNKSTNSSAIAELQQRIDGINRIIKKANDKATANSVHTEEAKTAPAIQPRTWDWNEGDNDENRFSDESDNKPETKEQEVIDIVNGVASGEIGFIDAKKALTLRGYDISDPTLKKQLNDAVKTVLNNTKPEIPKAFVKPIDEDPFDVLPLERTSSDFSTKREQEDAFLWFTKSFLSDNLDLNLAFIDNPKAFATFAQDSITLFEGSNYTMLYHEAWHNFSQHYLSKPEKTKLYQAVAKLLNIDSFDAISDYRNIEEGLAEAFREYSRNPESNIKIKVRNKEYTISRDKRIVNIFKRIRTFFKNLFSTHKTAEDIIRSYMKEAKSPSTLRKSNNENSFYTTLNTDRPNGFLTKENIYVKLDYSALYEMEQALDYMFVDAFDRLSNRKRDIEGKLVFETEEERNNRTSNVANINSLLAISDRDRTKLVKLIYSNVLSQLEDKRDSIEDEAKKQEFDAVIDNFSYFIDNAGDFRGSLTGKIKGDIDLTLEELGDEESKLSFGEVFENMSNYEHASDAIINAIRIIPKLDKDGKTLAKSTYWGLPTLDNFNRNWTILSKNLADLDFPEMVSKIEELSKDKYPQFKYLLRSINPDYSQAKLGPILLRNTFQQVFGMASISEMITLMSMDEKTGQVVTKFIESGTNLTKDLQRQWDSDFFSTFQDLTSGDRVLDITSLLDKYTEESLGSSEGMLEFMRSIGIQYTNENEVKNILDKGEIKYAQAAVRIWKKLFNLNKSGHQVIFPLESVSSDHKSGKNRMIKGENAALKTVTDLETQTNETLSDDQRVRADGNSSWRYMLQTYITGLVRDIKKYTHEELKDIYPQLDTDKNPEILNSYWFNSLFVLNHEASELSESPVYDKRDIDENYLEYMKTGGLKSEDIDEGEVTINLDATDKLIMDFYSFVNSAVEENVRFADKSAAGALRMNVEDNFLPNEEYSLKEQIVRIRKAVAKQIVGEIAAIQYLKSISEDERKKLKWYKQNYTDKALDNMIYGGNLEPELQSVLVTSRLNKTDTGWELEDSRLQSDLEREVSRWFKLKAIDFKSRFEEAYGYKEGEVDINGEAIPPLDYKYLLPAKFKSDTEWEVFEFYYSHSVLNRIEQFNFVYGSPRNYESGDSVFKRLAAYGATGKYATIDKPFLKWANSNKQFHRNIEAIYNDGKHRIWDDKFGMVHFKDIPVEIEEYSPKELEDNENLSIEEKRILHHYNDKKSKETDASGNITLDFYRHFLISIGVWNPKMENSYQLQLEFERSKFEYNKPNSQPEAREAFELAKKNANDSIKGLTSIFNIKKLQYSGSIYSQDPNRISSKMDIRAFEKFALNPLIPSVIYGTKFEKIAENLYRTHSDMTNFSSGSKDNWDAPLEDFNKWASDNKNESFTPSLLSLRSLKEQVPIEDIMKTEGIFASQMRKELSVGIFNKGEVVSGREKGHTYYEAYKQNVEDITNIAKAELAQQFSSPKKLAEYVKREFDKREIPDHIADFIQYYEDENRLKDPLDFSFQSFQLQNVLFSIVNNKIVKQRFSGGQFIEAPNTGYTNASQEDIEAYGNSDLKFYRVESKDGDTLPMEIKIAFSPKYHSLLQIVWNDERIEVQKPVLDENGEHATNKYNEPIYATDVEPSLIRLNALLLDSDFVLQHGDKFTLVGCKIPVQLFPTIEAMRVKQFLPAVAGQIVVVPSGITIKAGTDFDIDEMNIYEPSIDRYGNLTSYIPNEKSTAAQDYTNITKQIDKNKARIESIHTEIKLAESNASLQILPTTKGKRLSLEDLQAPLNESLDPLKKELNELGNINKELYKKRNLILPAQSNSLILNISKVILDRANFVTLMTRNDTDYLNAAYSDRGITPEALNIPLSSVTDPLVSNEVFKRNTVGKQSLAIDAKSLAFLTMSIEAGLRVNAPSPSSLRRNINKDGSLSLSSLYSQSSSNNHPPLYIPKVISEFVSGHVDMAKDARIAEILADRLRTPLYLYMIIEGTHLEDVIDFITKPHIREIADKYSRQSRITYKTYITNLLKKKAPAELAIQKVLTDALRKYSEHSDYIVKQKKAKFMDTYETAKNILSQDNINQITRRELVDTAEFIVQLTDQQNKFKSLSQAISWDTATSKNFVEMNYAKVQLDLIRDTGWFNEEALDHMQNKSVIASLEPSDFVNDYYTGSFSIISRPAYIKANIELFNTVFGQRLENFSRDYQNDFITYLFQNFATAEDGTSLYKYLMFDLDLLNKENPSNIQKQWENIKKKMKDPEFHNNEFVKSLMFSKVRKSNTISPELKNSNIDPHTANLIYNDILKLLYPTFSDKAMNDKLQVITNILIQTVALKDGVNKTFRGFQALIPTDTFTELFRKLLQNEKLQKQLNDPSSNIYHWFTQMFKVNRRKYFKKGGSRRGYDPQNRFNYYYEPMVDHIENDADTKSFHSKEEAIASLSYPSFVWAMSPTKDVKLPKDKHYGNPFMDNENPTDDYNKWLTGELHQDVEPKRRDWILSQIQSGALYGKTLVSYDPDNLYNSPDILSSMVYDQIENKYNSQPIEEDIEEQEDSQEELPIPDTNDAKILSSKKFRTWFSEEHKKDPSIQVIDALEYYKKCIL